MSRAKFEEWMKANFEDGDITSDAEYRIWLAGRESMRDEAASQWYDCFYESVAEIINIGEAIRKIEP